MLVLPIKKKWFDMIASGKKKEEYREIKPYYDNRIGRALCGIPFKYVHPDYIKKCIEEETIEVILRNGYSYESPSIWCECKVKIGKGKKEWGAIPGKDYYILEIIKIDSINQGWRYGERRNN